MDMNPFRSLFLSLSRMPPALMLIIILGLAVVVTMLVQSKFSESEQRVAQMEKARDLEKNQKATIVKATKDIEKGTEITAEALEESQIEAGKVPEGAVTSKQEAQGNIAAYTITTGSPIVRHMFELRTGVVGGFESKIKEGHRALTFAVDTNSGVAGFIAPASHVDIYAVTGGGPETNAGPVLSDVEVVAVGTTYQKAPGAQSAANPAGSVTVVLSPDDAQKLIKAVKAASLYLTLRSDKDHTPIAVVEVSSLFAKAAKPAAEEVAALPPPPLPGGAMAPGAPAEAGANAPPPPPPMHEIEMWSGSKKEVLSVPQG